MQNRRALIIGAAAVATAGIVAVVATGTLRHLDQGATPADHSPSSAASGTPSAAASPTPPAPAAALAPVLEPVREPAAVDAEALADRIEKIDQVDGSDVSITVLGVDSDTPLYQRNADTALIPASTNKVLTVAAALKRLGPTHRFTTAVVSADLSGDTVSTDEPSHNPSAKPSHDMDRPELVLVGGGDPYLAGPRKNEADPGQASLQDLAARTAKQLKKDKVTSVDLSYDTSLFSGPDWNPRWRDVYTDYVTRTTALWADEGRLYGDIGPRQNDPAEAAAELFADQLESYGVKVGSIDAGRAEPEATTIAAVESLSLERIVERLLMSSDNDAAEVIARHVALAADRPGSITEASRTIRQTLSDLGAWDESSRSYDGSGLSRDTRVSSAVLARVVQLAASGAEPSLGPLLTGLPVAGVEGSLRYRFDTSGATAGRGIVRAKTGTLTEVRSLAGYAYTADGELLVFAVMINGVADDLTALTWLDRTVAAIAGCGCRA